MPLLLKYIFLSLELFNCFGIRIILQSPINSRLIIANQTDFSSIFNPSKPYIQKYLFYYGRYGDYTLIIQKETPPEAVFLIIHDNRFAGETCNLLFNNKNNYLI